MTLYAVWAAPALTLEAESADWSSGSITLRCTDADTSGAAHKYSLFFWDYDALEMIPVEGSEAVNVTPSADGVAHLKDSTFLSRVGGLDTVVYQVKDENGRTCDCDTRKRHGLFVGVGDYEKSYKEKRKISELPGAESDAKEFAGIAERLGGVVSAKILTGTKAERQALDRKLDDMADKAKPGDICLFYITTHGGMEGTTGVMRLYDGDYTDDRFAGKVARFHGKGVAFVAILGTCFSEGLLQQSFPNVGVIAAAQAENVSDAFFDGFLFTYGWNKGWAGSGDTVTFGELADYAKARYDALYRGITIIDENKQNCYPMTFRAHIDNGGLLDRIVAGKRGTHGAESAPRSGAGVSASQGMYQRTIEVSWEADSAADEYLLFYGRGGTDCYLDSTNVSATSCAFRVSDHPWMAEYSAENPVRFEIRAYNGAGVGVFGGAVGWVDSEAMPALPPEWLQCHHATYDLSGGDVAVASAMTAANGCRTVGECYACGIDPEDPNDDLKIVGFTIENGKPVITLNHTKDGSGESFAHRIRTLGSKSLDASVEWDDITDIANPDADGYHFFKVKVEMP